MKVLYILTIIICVIFIMVIYFTNIIYMWNQQMYLWSQNNRISVAAWLWLLMLISAILWASVVLLLKSLVNQRPKDFDDFDL